MGVGVCGCVHRLGINHSSSIRIFTLEGYRYSILRHRLDASCRVCVDESGPVICVNSMCVCVSVSESAFMYVLGERLIPQLRLCECFQCMSG